MAAVENSSLELLHLPDKEPCYHRSYSSLGKKYRKGRVINHKHKQDKQDARKEIAKTFLLSIPLDANPMDVAQGKLRSLSKVRLESVVEDTVKASPSNMSSAHQSTFNTTAAVTMVTPMSHNSLQRNVMDSPRTRKKKTIMSRKYSQPYIADSTGLFNDSRRIAFLSHGYPLMYSSVISYRKPEKKHRLEGQVVGGHRIRSNSTSIQVEIDTVDSLLDSTQEISLMSIGLLTSVWINKAVNPLSNKHQAKRTPLTHQFSLKEGLSPPTLWDTSSAHMFRENHTPQNVLTNYYPDLLDNDKFRGRNMVVFNLIGYTISVIGYARESEIKKEINGRFTEAFPHIKITLTKLRSIKREMVLFGVDFGLEPVQLAHSHVYFEKLVLMSHVNKSNRKVIAFTCLILAAKFSSDLKKNDIKDLIEEASDRLKMSQKEFMSFELQTLLALQFSLLTPTYQLQSHYDKIIKEIYNY